jgi:hypothetical protein
MPKTKRDDGSASRRRFLGQLGMTVGVLAGTGAAGGQAPPAGAYPAAGAPTAAPEPRAGAPSEWFPRQDPALVRETVGLSHRDLPGVRALVEKRPELAKAQWDWGYGDWESALDAASHTGQREIALFLLRNGARPTIFSAAMLGQLDVVKAFVAASPGIQSTPGPHGISLLAHARVGGDAAAPVAEYLTAVGGADAARPAPLSAAENERYVGTYGFGPGAGDRLEVSVGTVGLGIAQPGSFPRGLLSVGEHAFHPVGAPSVRVRFEMAGARAMALAIYDPDLVVRAARAAG